MSPGLVLDRAVALLTAPLCLTDDRYSTMRVYVSGPTGSGKSRLGWEVFQHVKANKDKYKLANVAFASVNLAKPSVRTKRDVVGHLMRTCAKGSGPYGLANAQLHEVTLTGVVRNLTGWTEGGGRTALVLHLDEFQFNPKAVLAIQEEVAQFNEAVGGQYCVLPLCTGLYNKDFLGHKDLDASDHSHAVYLGYLSKEDGSTDHDATWAIVRNAAHAVLQQNVLPEALSDVPDVLGYLVEDLGGWPMAAVQLGGQLATCEALRSAAEEQKPVSFADLAAAPLKQCEMDMDGVLSKRYDGPLISLKDTLTSTGIFKLIILILSPFPVGRGLT